MRRRTDVGSEPPTALRARLVAAWRESSLPRGGRQGRAARDLPGAARDRRSAHRRPSHRQATRQTGGPPGSRGRPRRVHRGRESRALGDVGVARRRPCPTRATARESQGPRMRCPRTPFDALHARGNITQAPRRGGESPRRRRPSSPPCRWARLDCGWTQVWPRAREWTRLCGHPHGTRRRRLARALCPALGDGGAHARCPG